MSRALGRQLDAALTRFGPDVAAIDDAGGFQIGRASCRERVYVLV